MEGLYGKKEDCGLRRRCGQLCGSKKRPFIIGYALSSTSWILTTILIVIIENMSALEPSQGNPTLRPSLLPVAQLESLRFKINQIIESIQVLQRSIELNGQNFMLPWPEILSKYNILLSQTHSLSMSLVMVQQAASQQARPGGTTQSANLFEKLALHPSVGMTDAQLDNDVIPLLRNQQTTDVLRVENETVRHLSEHMATRGVLGVLAPPATNGPSRLGLGGSQSKRTEYEDVLQECDQIRVEHDLRIERAVRAVAMLREKYDWKARVEVEQEEPEELDWDPRMQGQVEGVDEMMGVESESTPGAQSNDTEEEEELEEVLGNGGDHSPGASQPGTPSVDVAMVQG
ncbi:hypothetical protein EIP91_003387 [Steccherinum ochraceum]|uniref:Mediator of RNA polymerase II transcription subunit 8 n=1 Tax=Steccherinum ochraceum TaxID=92696 RepID=A0A4R0RRA8_9APHY|nr:hypothetical protein EIP91_003387 [Steccherinum ochraceum]